MTLEIITAIPLSIAGAYLYRRGGTSAGTLWRDLGMPCCMLAYFFGVGKMDWPLFWCFGLMFAAQTSYFKPKGTDAKWLNWLAVGLVFSFAMLPYAWDTGHWGGFIIRLPVVTIFTILWSEFWGNATVEEFGRGFIQIITLPLLVL